MIFMNALILVFLVCICLALYAMWRTQIVILKVLRQINVKALNAVPSSATSLNPTHSQFLPMRAS